MCKELDGAFEAQDTLILNVRTFSRVTGTERLCEVQTAPLWLQQQHNLRQNCPPRKEKEMQTIMLVLIVLVIAVVVIAALSKKQQGPKEIPDKAIEGEKPRACPPLTKNEQAMFFRLQSALPTLIVLSQVSFGALLTAKSRGARNTFDRKRADFVICDKSFKVLAVIELDDSSHDGREAQDANRDKLLKDAGYRVLRYRGIPDIEQVAMDFR